MSTGGTEEETEAGARGSAGSVVSEQQTQSRATPTPATNTQPTEHATGEHQIHRTGDSDDEVLDDLQRKAFHFFEMYVNPDTGLVLDSTQPGSPSSIAAVGFALSCYPVAVEHGWMPRELGLSQALMAARFFDNADQSGARDGVGYKGFFYHFLAADTGKRAWKSELSTIDTALLMVGLLVAAHYFDGTSPEERELRKRVDAIYARIDWRWAQNGGASITMGWKPESGFLRWRWTGYNEALLLYVLALAAPKFNVQRDAYDAWTSTYRWRRVYGRDVLYGGPLFMHQFSHIWLDLRGIRDDFMRDKDSDYFENSRRSTCIQREYAQRNPRGFPGYRNDCWGFTASDGPGDGGMVTVTDAHGRETQRRFYGYRARGAPFGPDDGTISPWAAIASLPFAPKRVMQTIRYLEGIIGHSPKGFGFHASFNPGYPDAATGGGWWVSPWHYALNQGPIVLMIENHRSGFIWNLMHGCETIRTGLQRAGFEDGWLEGATADVQATDSGIKKRL